MLFNSTKMVGDLLEKSYKKEGIHFFFHLILETIAKRKRMKLYIIKYNIDDCIM